MGRYGTRQARLRDGDCWRGTRGRVSMTPAGRGDERGGLGPLRPGLLPPARRTSPVAARLCVGCCLPSTWALRICSLYFSPFPWSPRGSRGDPPARPRPAGRPRPIRSRAHALPGFAAGSEPSGGGHSPWTADSEGSGAGMLGFPSPTFLSRPTGMCSSSRRRAPRGNTTSEPKKTTNPYIPRDEGGRGTVLGISGAGWLEKRTNKEDGRDWPSLLCAGT
uniref:Uncharacterized protein n=1 Tax=Rousettus aegyptiacus TaxID=9407 RepID=A0A7J8KBH8_ROUAE|nr:hypothetical protein HJG63_008022 [Rousettus aegyptiacus]